MVTLRQLLEDMVQRKASDLHLTAGVPPEFRIDGSVTPSEHEVLTPEMCASLAYSVLSDEQRKKFELKITGPDPTTLRGDIEAILRGYKIQYEMRSAGPKELCYETELPFEVRTDRVSNAILLLQPGSEMEVGWDEKKKK